MTKSPMKLDEAIIHMKQVGKLCLQGIDYEALSILIAAECEKAHPQTVLPGTKMSEKKNVSGKPPLSEGHICFERGHSMYEVFKFKNAANGHSSEWGQHKCSRCGYEENWQYDFV